MQVIYQDSVVERLDKSIEWAANINKKIKHIILTRSEFDELTQNMPQCHSKLCFLHRRCAEYDGVKIIEELEPLFKG